MILPLRLFQKSSHDASSIQTKHQSQRGPDPNEFDSGTFHDAFCFKLLSYYLHPKISRIFLITSFQNATATPFLLYYCSDVKNHQVLDSITEQLTLCCSTSFYWSILFVARGVTIVSTSFFCRRESDYS